MSDIRRVLVVGGGVGGLTAATAFAQRGVEVVLIERRPTFDVPGIGLGQPANALRVYDALGVLARNIGDGIQLRPHVHLRCEPRADRRTQVPPRRRKRAGNLRPVAIAVARNPAGRCQARRRGGAYGTNRRRNPRRERPDRSIVFGRASGFLRSCRRLRWNKVGDAAHVVGTAFAPRPSGYGGWRVQVPRHEDVRCMEFLQGIGGKTGAMPLRDDLMYIFHICPEAPDADFKRRRLRGPL